MNDTHILYYVNLKWYNPYANSETEDEITAKFYAFAESFSDLTERIDKEFSDIISVKIKQINIMATPQDFFYVDNLSYDERKKIEEVNDY